PLKTLCIAQDCDCRPTFSIRFLATASRRAKMICLIRPLKILRADPLIYRQERETITGAHETFCTTLCKDLNESGGGILAMLVSLSSDTSGRDRNCVRIGSYRR